MQDKKKKPPVNTTDKKLTYSLPMKKMDTKTGADLAATTRFVQQMKKNNLSFKDIKFGSKVGFTPTIKVKNPDYQKPKSNAESIPNKVRKKKKKKNSMSDLF